MGSVERRSRRPPALLGALLALGWLIAASASAIPPDPPTDCMLVVELTEGHDDYEGTFQNERVFGYGSGDNIRANGGSTASTAATAETA